jgi:class 3 adenylate cyclase/predicted ATPase/ABC-type transport system involved in cytochrome c biogenesis ATPase subunit
VLFGLARRKHVDVAVWLRDLGLAQYEQAFRDNAIDAEILSKLTADDLKDIGVTVVGHRRKLLQAIADQLSAAPSAMRGAKAPLPQDLPSAERRAERRQLTVLFVDLVESTALAGRIDVEEMREVITAYQNTVADVIARFGGHVAKYMGDGVLCYFGWPKAHEDDAERAVRAGLAVTDAVAKLSGRPAGKLAARVGIATGLVVVGDLVGEGAAQEEAVIGETPNLAARLQALAEPGTVAVAEGTRQLLGQLFNFAPLGAHQLRGFAKPVTAFHASGEAFPASRFEALRGENLTPLVGRGPELDLMLDRWRHARDGDGQVILVSGEPGLGKSRLLQILRERLAAETHTRLSYFCSPYHRNTALHPFLDQIERAAGLKREDAPEEKLDKLEALFDISGQHVTEAAVMTADLLGIPLPTSPGSPALSPQGRRAKLQQIWLEQLAGLAAKSPVLMLLEDAHWIDPSSIDQFDLIINRLQRLAALLVVTFRPEFVHPWGRYPHVTALSLNRLAPRQSAALVDRIAGGRSLPAQILEQVLAKADGVPLFLEELTKAVLESGLLREAGDGYQLPGPLPRIGIPATLHDSLMARLDRLAPAKEVAQVASVIGREFSYDLLAAASGLDEQALSDSLNDLLHAELIFRRSLPPAAVYGFKHALVLEAAYASMLRGKRQRTHARIAQVLEAGFPETPPEVLAHHLTEGDQTETSVDWWAKAGQQALSRAANKEAVSHFERALAQLQKLPETNGRKRREAALNSALAGAMLNATGLASEALEQTYKKARDLCQQIGDTRQQFIVEWGLWHVYVGRADILQARPLAERLRDWAEREQDPELLLQANHAEWAILSFLGEHSATRAACEHGWALYDETRHGDHAFSYGGHDPGVCSRNQSARATWCLGYPEQARAQYEEGLALARRLSHPQILLHGLTAGMTLFHLCRDDVRFEAQADAAFEIAAEQDFADYRSDALIMRNWLLSKRSEARDAVKMIRGALAERSKRGTFFNRPFHLALLAGAEARAGDTGAALATVAEALEYSRSSGEEWMKPYLFQVKAELLLGGTAEAREEAERCLLDALRSARANAARGWEIRAATRLARLWAEQMRREEARRLLEPVYGWFTEGHDTPDLTDAKALLDQLS